MRPKIRMQPSCHMGLFISQLGAPLPSANWQIDVYGYWLGPGLIGGGWGVERAWLCPDRPIHTARSPSCAGLCQEWGLFSQNIEHGTHPPQHLSPTTQRGFTSLSSSHLLILGSFAAPFPFSSFTLLSNWSADLHLQPAQTLNSLIRPSAARPGLSLLPLLFLTATKKSFNIHFSLLFQTVLKINFKIFLLDPVI